MEQLLLQRGEPTMKRTFCVAAVAFLSMACSTTPTFQTGEDAEVTFDGLTRMEGTVLDAVWARTDFDVSGFDKIMFEGLGVEFRPVSGPYSGRGGTTSMSTSRNQTEFPMDEATQQLFIEEIRAAFLEEMARSDVFQVVEEPGPQVLKLRVGLYDVVSRVPPETVGRSRIYLDSVGEATLVLELRESASNAILVRAVDRRAAGRTGSHQMTVSNRATNMAEVRRLARRWASILTEGLDTLLTEGVKPAQ
jgi:hypothetical protein